MNESSIVKILDSYKLAKRQRQYIFVDPDDSNETCSFDMFINSLDNDDVEFINDYLNSKSKREFNRGLENFIVLSAHGIGTELIMKATGMNLDGAAMSAGIGIGAIAFLKHSGKSLAYRNLNRAIQNNYVDNHPSF